MVVCTKRVGADMVFVGVVIAAVVNTGKVCGTGVVCVGAEELFAAIVITRWVDVGVVDEEEDNTFAR